MCTRRDVQQDHTTDGIKKKSTNSTPVKVTHHSHSVGGEQFCWCEDSEVGDVRECVHERDEGGGQDDGEWQVPARIRTESIQLSPVQQNFIRSVFICKSSKVQDAII